MNFRGLWKTLLAKKNQAIIYGDFNLDSVKTFKNISEAEELLDAFRFSQRNNCPTRVTTNSRRCINHIHAKNTDTKYLKISKSGGLFPVLIEIPCSDACKSCDVLPTDFRNLKVLENDEIATNFFLAQALNYRIVIPELQKLKYSF